MELKYKLAIGLIFIFTLLGLTIAATQHIYVDTEFHGKDIKNVTNITIKGKFTDGTFSVERGNFTGVGTIHATNYYASGTSSNISLGCGNLTGVPSDLCTATSVADTNETTRVDAIISNYIPDNITGHEATYKHGNTTAEINAVSNMTDHVANFKHGNTTAEMNAVIWNTTDNLGWKNLTDYPSACSPNYSITGLGDSVTCTAVNANVKWNDIDYNITQSVGYYHCFDDDCNTSIHNNGTALIIKVS